MSADTDSQPLPLGWIEPLVTVPVGIPAPRGHRDDAALVAAADLAAVYDRYGDALFRFALGLLRDREAAADCVQEVFHTAASRLHQLRDPSALRAWLFAIARHEVSRRHRTGGREIVAAELPDRPGAAPDPPTRASQRELAELMGEASRGLPDRDRAALALHYHQDLDGPEIAAALGLSLTNTTTLLARARATFERSLAALLLARRARAGRSRCPELTALVAGWDGEVTVLWRKRTARHIDVCPTCTADRADAVNPRTLLGAVPVLVPTPRWLKAASLQHVAAAVPARGLRSWWPPAARAGLFAGLSSGGAALAFAAAVPVAGLLAAGSAPLTAVIDGGPVTEQPSAPGPGAGRESTPTSPPPRFGFDMPTFAVPPPPGAAPLPGPVPRTAAPPAASNGTVSPTTGAPPPSRRSLAPPLPPMTLEPAPGEDPRSAEPQPTVTPTPGGN